MGRTHPIALRLRALINWPSNVRHAFISSYVKHIFQNNIISEPAIRASTTGIWINITVFTADSVFTHPKLPAATTARSTSSAASSEGSSNSTPAPTRSLSATPAYIEFRNVDLASALGKFETRIRNLTLTSDKKHYYLGTIPKASTKVHPYYGPLLKSSPPTPLAAIQGGTYDGDVLKALQIFRDTPIHLRVNCVSNPLMNAEVMAQFVASQLKGGKSLNMVYKQLLRKAGVGGVAEQ